MLSITDETVSALRERIRPYLKSKRYLHTLGVEEEAERIGRIYMPDKVEKLRVSALLHDITKRETLEKQLQYCEEFGIIVGQNDLCSPRALHAVTAAALAEKDFSDTVDPEILSGIRWHTTGCDGMGVFESIVYLADYIEPNRTFDDCVSLRNYFWGGMPEEDDPRGLVVHLCRTMVMSFDFTLRSLIDSGEPVHPDTVLARNCFIDRLSALL